MLPKRDHAGRVFSPTALQPEHGRNRQERQGRKDLVPELVTRTTSGACLDRIAVGLLFLLRGGRSEHHLTAGSAGAAEALGLVSEPDHDPLPKAPHGGAYNRSGRSISSGRGELAAAEQGPGEGPRRA